ncbi:hypothetical protein [Lapidilactobacillus luobeiensis]|uniref:hypothetical protein n=1 Tax=Lapidilactobacillus luobeiensis TaxID=2950371 RepID=UPI0021C3C4D7|nr:hypothetical protein [Lapidilactobacillus luobeiensis]
MKLQYKIDEVGNPTGETQLVADDIGETAEYKNGWENDGFYNHVWTDSGWIGNNDGRPESTPDPTTQDQINASVLAQIAQDKSDQAVFNSQMLLQVATLKGGN